MVDYKKIIEEQSDINLYRPDCGTISLQKEKVISMYLECFNYGNYFMLIGNEGLILQYRKLLIFNFDLLSLNIKYKVDNTLDGLYLIAYGLRKDYVVQFKNIPVTIQEEEDYPIK